MDLGSVASLLDSGVELTLNSLHSYFTHSVQTNQRHVELNALWGGGTTLTLKGPATTNLYPPGEFGDPVPSANLFRTLANDLSSHQVTPGCSSSLTGFLRNH